MVALALLLTFILTAFIRTTRLGKAMRATAEDPDTARLMGINVDMIIALTFIIGSALAGIGGVLAGMYLGQVNFFMGFIAGLKAFTAAVLGGIGNIGGAVLGPSCSASSRPSGPPTWAGSGRTCSPSGC